MVAYLDASALVKLVVEEPESRRVRAVLRDWPRQASSALARVEVARAARRHGDRELGFAREIVADLTLIRLDDELLDRAATIDPQPLRSLDAIHVASAQSLGDALGALITYDARMLAAAESAGLPTLSPR